MPKIISNSIISSSDNRDDPQGLHSYYCLCSEFILVIGKCFAHSYIDIKTTTLLFLCGYRIIFLLAQAGIKLELTLGWTFFLSARY